MSSCNMLDRLDLTLSKGSEDHFYMRSAYKRRTLGFNSNGWSLSVQNQPNRRQKASAGSLKASLLVVQFKQKQSSSTSPLRLEYRLPLCCNWRLFSERPAKTRAVNWRTGSGPEGSGPAETQSFDAEWEDDRFLKGKTFYFWGLG